MHDSPQKSDSAQLNQLQAHVAQLERAAVEAEARFREVHTTLHGEVNRRTDELAEINQRLREEIRERVRVETELARHQSDLEHLVEERTVELEQSHQQLRRAERLASIGTLAAGIAHEINNPLGVIMLAAENALSIRDDSESAELLARFLNDIMAHTERCASIVKNLLQFSRPQSAVRRPEDLNLIVRRALDSVAKYASRMGANVAMELAEGLPPIAVSRIEIEQVISNLLRNAIESTDLAQVVVRTSRQPNSLSVTVADNGRGMTQEQKQRMFDPFFTTQQLQGRMGLGLSIAHGLAQSHGATFDVQSQPQQGTTISVAFPLSNSEPQKVS